MERQMERQEEAMRQAERESEKAREKAAHDLATVRVMSARDLSKARIGAHLLFSRLRTCYEGCKGAMTKRAHPHL